METTHARYRWSEQRDKIAAALVAFQKTVAPVTKNKTAKVEKDGRLLYTYEYADLGDVIESTKDQRAAAGLAVVQFPTGDANGVTIITTVLHESGQWYEGELTLRPAGGKVQEIGSAITYGRRYCYAAALGLCTEADDDGNAADGNSANTQRRDAKPPGASWGKPKAVPTPKAPSPATPGAKSTTASTPGSAGGTKTPASTGTSDTGEVLDPGQLADLTEAFQDKWGKSATRTAPSWLKAKFGTEDVGSLTKTQALEAILLLQGTAA